jgi:hypothetical protein
MCYELFFKNRKSTQDQLSQKVASVIERVSAAKAPVQRRPTTQAEEKKRIESELETTTA